jgi:protein-S-isoprenylcysteine O-methyltransferase Ste14
MNIGPGTTIEIAWVVFLFYWVISSFSAKKIARREGGAAILRRIVMGFAAYFLLVRSHDARLGFLTASPVPETLSLAWFGAALTCLGVAFAIWARIHIGRYWSATVSLKAEHKLIKTGPYARIRHPIYTGILLALLGSAAATDTYGALLAVAIYLIGFWLKARKEEALLAHEFGVVFEEYWRQTGFLLPRFIKASGG